MFKTFLRIALFSLLRRKSRTVMVIGMIGACFWGILVMEGFYDGMTEQVIDNAIRSSSGHLTLYSKGYRLERDLNRLIAPAKQISQHLDGSTEIQGYTRRVLQDCLVATSHYAQNGQVIGVELEKEKNAGRLNEYLVEGEYSFGKKGRGMILGAKLADKLKVKIGSKIVLSAQDSKNEISAQALRVSGILRTNNLAIDERSVFIDLVTAQTFLNIGSGVNQISIFLENQSNLSPLQKQLQESYPQLDVLSWQESYPALKQSKEIMKIFNLVTSFIVFTVAGIGIFGVILVSVLERLREFGVMLALGTRIRQIFLLVSLEALSMSLLGYVVGGIVGGTTLYAFTLHGLDLTIFSEGLEAFGLDTMIYPVIRLEYFMTALTAILFAGICSVIYPIWVLQRSRPIESINRN